MNIMYKEYNFKIFPSILNYTLSRQRRVLRPPFLGGLGTFTFAENYSARNDAGNGHEETLLLYSTYLMSVGKLLEYQVTTVSYIGKRFVFQNINAYILHYGFL